MSVLRSSFLVLLVAVVIVQGTHVVEHVIQLAQVFLLHTPDADALGLLGYVFQFQGTEEWLHLVFNATYLLALYLLLLPLYQQTPHPVPTWAFWTFAVWGVGLESWHMVEHIVIIANVVRNDGCPCVGIGDVALGVSDTVLHFFYDALTFTALLLPAGFIGRSWLEASRAAATPLRPV